MTVSNISKNDVKSKIGIKNLIKKAFSRGSEDDFDKTKTNAYKIRQDSIFLNDSDHEQMLNYGWFVAEDVIKVNELEEFRIALKKVRAAADFDMDKEFMNLGCFPNMDIRNITQEVIARQAEDIFGRVFNLEKIEPITGGTFVLKPAHEDSGLPTHQDASILDEEKEFSLSVWIPLVDITVDNGALWVLPGSHLWGNTQRGFGVPWKIEKYIDLLNEHMEPVYLNAGDAVIFDTALIHSSVPNNSKIDRDALFISVVKKDPEIIYYFQNKNLSEDVLEMYHVNREFFDQYDFESRPDESKWRKEIVPYNRFEPSKDQLVKLIRNFTP